MKLTVIGAGPGGYAAAFAAAEAGAEVTLVERRALGGTCLHTGCIPAKTLRASADVLEAASRAAEFGLSGVCGLSADMSAVQARKQRVIALLRSGLEKTAARLGVRVVYGAARVVSAASTLVRTADGEREIPGESVIIAVGSLPSGLSGLPADPRIFSGEAALDLQTVPDHLLVVGGGVVGCELACIYRAFGARVTVVEAQERLLPFPSVDAEVSRLLLREMKKKGIAVKSGRTVIRGMPEKNGVAVTLGASPWARDARAQEAEELHVSAVCIAVGRVPATENLGLAEAGVSVDAAGWIVVNDMLETSVSGIYAVGDVLGPRRIMLAHMARAEARTAVRNILCPDDRRRQTYEATPSAIFTSPEIGVVGLSEEEARTRYPDVRCSVFQIRELGKAQAMGALAGFFKLVADAESGVLLGAHIAGARASDLIAEAVLALRKGCTAEELSGTIHAHPTLAEGLGEAAELLAFRPN